MAAVADPPSPEYPAVPLPATVVIVPPADTLRMRWLPTSTIRKPPSGVGAIPKGIERFAEVAGPPSPLKPCVPLPAIVVITPDGETFRTR